MIETLRIQNYALIEDVEIEFRPGLSVLTGETGAGKSILIDALHLALGARASSETVRERSGQGETPSRAKVEAVFRIANPSRRLARLLKEYEVELEDGALLLSRTVTADGRSRAYAGSCLVPVSVLEAIGDELVDLHGQHEHQSLLRPDRQLDVLDAFAGTEQEAAVVAQMVSDLRAMDKTISELETFDRERERRLDFLRFEVAEIDGAHLEPGEDEQLRASRNLIANAEKVVELTAQAYAALYEGQGTSAIDMLAVAQRSLEELAQVDGAFQSWCSQLDEIRSQIQEISREVRGFTERVEFDPAELERLNQRLAILSGLKRKYGESVEAILEYRNRAVAEILQYEQRDQRLSDLRRARQELQKKVDEAGQILSRHRRAAGRKLDKRVTVNLRELGMKAGRFEAHFETAPLTSNGIDRVEMLLAANPGEKLKPLRHVASGGEISRVMLALKTVFAEADRIPTLIFDEIDAGVGATMAGKVASKLRELAESHQTICITHLPQIAASAQAHYRVDKIERRGRTVTTVERIDENARVEEVARLLDGSVSDLSLEHARALLARNR